MTVSVQHIILMLEFFLLMLFCVPLPVLTFGNAAGIVFSILLILFTAEYPAVSDFITKLFYSGFLGKAAVISILLIIAVSAAFILLLCVRMKRAASNHPDTDKPCTLIVLGCRVKGTRPTRMLRRRLDAAFEYLQNNPQAVCIVSGGKGRDERISEAQAMRDYLLSKGLPSSRIFSEDKSVNTLENLKFSKIIAEQNSLPDRFAIATDGFHQYRASLLAKRTGITPKAVSAKTEPRYALTYIVREWLALTAIITGIK